MRGCGPRGAGEIERARLGERLKVEEEVDARALRCVVPPAQGDGFGLQSVRERMRALGVGHGLELETAPGRGTRARVRLPMTTMHETEGRIER